MRARIRKVKFNSKGKNPVYKVILECPKRNELYIHFDYSYTTKSYWPLEVNYDGEHKGAKLEWFTREVEGMTVDAFLGIIAKKINKKYGFTFVNKI